MSSLTITILLCVALVGVLVIKRRNEKTPGSDPGGEPAPGTPQRVSLRSRRKGDNAATRPRRARPRLALSVPGRLSGDEDTASVPAVPVVPAVPTSPDPATIHDGDDVFTAGSESPAPSTAPAIEVQPAGFVVDEAPSNQLIDAPGWPNLGELGAVMDYDAFDPHPDDHVADEQASAEPYPKETVADESASHDDDYDPATGWSHDEADEWTADTAVTEVADAELPSWSSETWSASESSQDSSADVSPPVSIDDLFEGAAVWDDPDPAPADEFELTPVLTAPVDADWEIEDESDNLSGDWHASDNAWTTSEDAIAQVAPAITPVTTLEREPVDADLDAGTRAIEPMSAPISHDWAPAPTVVDELAVIQASSSLASGNAAAAKARKKIKRLEKQLAQTQAELARVTQLLAETTQNQLLETVRRLEQTITAGVIASPEPSTPPVVLATAGANPRQGSGTKTRSTAKAPAAATRQRHPFVLSAKETRTLRALAVRRSQPQMRRRAQIVLAAARGESTATTAARLGVDVSTVRRWKARFVAERLAIVAGLEPAKPRR